MIKKLKIKNWCQHKSRDINFDGSLIGIFGSNGIGKSNLIDACRFLLTGSTAKKGNSKLEEITYGESEAELELLLTLENTDVEIYRKLVNEKDNSGEVDSYVCYSDKKITGISNVNSVLSDLIGLSPYIIKQNIFVPQGNIDKILFQTNSERKNEFQKLFGTDQAEYIRESLKKTALDVKEKKLELNNYLTNYAERSKIDKKIAHLEKEIANLTKLFNSVSTVHINAKRLLDKVQRVKELSEVVKADNELEIERQIEYSRLTNLLKSYLLTLNNFTDEKLKLTKQIGAAEANLNTHTLKTIEEEKTAKTQRLNELVKELNKLPFLVKYEYVQTLSKLSLNKYLKLFKTKLDLIEQDKCITCRQSIPKNWKTLKSKLSKLIKSLEINSVGKFVEEYESYKHTQTIKYKELTDLVKDIDALTDLSVQVKQYDKLKNKLTSISQTIEGTSFNIEQVKNSLAKIDTETTKILERRKAYLEQTIDVDEERISLAKDVVVTYDNISVKLTKIRAERDWLADKSNQLTAAMGDLLNTIDPKGIDNYAKLLDKTIDLLHRDKLPTLVNSFYINKLNTTLNDILSEFCSEFTVKISDDADFICKFTSGMEIPSDRLSGGQKMVLSLSYRFALAKLFSNKLNVIALDEPTVYLDSLNIANIANLLNLIRTYSTNTGMQVLIITHEEMLKPYFDQVIEL